MVALMAAVAIMMIMLAAAAPSWRYVMRNDAEEELLFELRHLAATELNGLSHVGGAAVRRSESPLRGQDHGEREPEDRDREDVGELHDQRRQAVGQHMGEQDAQMAGADRPRGLEARWVGGGKGMAILDEPLGCVRR